MRHDAQLHICHERVGPAESQSKRPPKWICNLAASTWCNDCGYYICRTHAVARHWEHDTVVED